MSSDAPLSPTLTDAQRARLTSPARLAALQATGLLDGAASPVLDRLARLVTRLLGVPVAAVSLVDDRGQHFAGLAGLAGWVAERRGTPLTHSFCQHVVVQDAPLMVEDAAQHPLVASNLAYLELGVVGYLGVPLRSCDGEVLGALCAIDTSPAAWTLDQQQVLEDLAAAAVAEIELRATTRALVAAQERLREQAMRDDLTGLLNRRGFGECARPFLELARRTGDGYLVIALDLDGFKQINDEFGHDAGDEALVEMASVLQQCFRASDLVARMGGDEFLVLCANAGQAAAAAMQARLASALAALNATPGREYTLAASIGCAPGEPGAAIPLSTLVQRADAAMYADKQRRRGLPATAGAAHA